MPLGLCRRTTLNASFLPIAARLKQKIFRDRRLIGDARPTIVAPAASRPSSAAIRLLDDTDRIVAYQEDTNAAAEMARINGHVTEHAATLMYHIPDAYIFEGSVYGKSGFDVVANFKNRSSIISGGDVNIDESLLCTNSVIDRYFGHWLMDGLVLERLAELRGLTPLTVSSKRWIHEAGYRHLLDMHDERQPHVRVKNLYIADDRGLNAMWVERALAIKRKLKLSLHGSVAAPAPVFMLRGSSGVGRHLVNEVEISEALQRRGFAVLSPEDETPAVIASVLSNAPIVVTVEGSAHNHVLLAASSGAWIITIMPPRRMNSFVKMRADALDMRWAFTVADDRGGQLFYQPIDRLLKVIEIAYAAHN